jgi:anti-anti-sigma factor
VFGERFSVQGNGRATATPHVSLPNDSTSLDPSVAAPPLAILVDAGDGIRVVKIAGELDLAGCELVARHCTEADARAVVVDLAALTFLDCGGYRAFVAARAELARHDRTLELTGAVGEPRRLLDLIRQFDP